MRGKLKLIGNCNFFYGDERKKCQKKILSESKLNEALFFAREQQASLKMSNSLVAGSQNPKVLSNLTIFAGLKCAYGLPQDNQ